MENAKALISRTNFEVANAHWPSPPLGAFFLKFHQTLHVSVPLRSHLAMAGNLDKLAANKLTALLGITLVTEP